MTVFSKCEGNEHTHARTHTHAHTHSLTHSLWQCWQVSGRQKCVCVCVRGVNWLFTSAACNLVVVWRGVCLTGRTRPDDHDTHTTHRKRPGPRSAPLSNGQRDASVSGSVLMEPCIRAG